ncbi:MAG: hypothetical protein SFX73_03230 [Kofleriaceae bacterium]|nr:hypothetical protein [Kofleriaceae bacterium]
MPRKRSRPSKAKAKGTPKPKAPAKRAKPTARKRASQKSPPTANPVNGVWPENERYDRGLELLPTDPLASAKELEAAVEQQPTRARIHINLAWAYSQAARHAAAKAAAQKAHELDSRDAYIAELRVHVLFDAADDAVVEAARHAMQLPDLDADDRRFVHSALCWTLMRTAPSAALRETEQLVAAAPSDAEVLATRGCALAAVCRWDEGVTWLDQAIVAAPDDERFVERRAQIIEARDVAEALLAKLRAATDRQPTDATPWRELGLGLAQFARLDEALRAFERARELDPGHSKRREPLVTAAAMVEATARAYVLVGDIMPIG